MLFRRNRVYDPQTGRFTQEDPSGLAGGMNLYGFGEGDPVSNTDPFGLKVCFAANHRNGLREAMETATNTTIQLDGNGCIASFRSRGARGYELLQWRLRGLVNRSTTYTVRSGAVGGPPERAGEYDGATNTATLDFDKFGTARYPFTVGGICTTWTLFGRRGLWNPSNTIVHEVLGHAYDGISADESVDEEKAVAVENQFHELAGEVNRDCYKPDDLRK